MSHYASVDEQNLLYVLKKLAVFSHRSKEGMIKHCSLILMWWKKMEYPEETTNTAWVTTTLPHERKDQESTQAKWGEMRVYSLNLQAAVEVLTSRFFFG